MSRRGSMSLRGWESTRGENSRTATISENMAQAILNARASGEPPKSVAMRYGVSQSVVSKIWRRVRWSHLKPETNAVDQLRENEMLRTQR